MILCMVFHIFHHQFSELLILFPISLQHGSLSKNSVHDTAAICCIVWIWIPTTMLMKLSTKSVGRYIQCSLHGGVHRSSIVHLYCKEKFITNFLTCSPGLIHWSTVKRFLLILTVIPVIAFAQSAPTKIFLDAIGHPHQSYIELLHTRGVVQGYGYGIFRPDILINRAEFLKILMLAVYGSEVYDIEQRQCFTDFFGSQQWFWSHACIAKHREVIEGYPDGSFRGTKTVNLAEALKIAAKAWNVALPTYVQAPPHWYDPYMDLAAGRGLFDYFPFDPSHLLTRSEMAYLIARFGEPIAFVGTSSSDVSSATSRRSSSASRASTTLCGNRRLDPGEQCDDGNPFDGDGCSSICVIVPEPVRHAALKIEQRDLGGLTQAIGSKGVTLLSFDATASRQDVWMTAVNLRVATGSIAAVTNVQLVADLDGDSVPERAIAPAQVQGSRIAFHSFQTKIPDGKAVRFEVRADLATTLVADRIGLAFDVQDAAFLSAVGDVDDRDLTGVVLNTDQCTEANCWIRVLTAAMRVISIRSVGNLYVTRDSTPAASRLLLAGELSDTLLRLAFHATGEDIRVRTVSINGATTNVDRLEFFDPGSAAPFAIARASQCPVLIAGQLCSTTEFTVLKDTQRVVLVRAILKADVDGAVPTDTIALTLTASTGNTHAIDARGNLSGVDLQQNDSDSVANGEIFVGTGSPAANTAIAGPLHDIVLSKISAIVNDLQESDDTPVPTGQHLLGSFRFSAATNRNVKEGLNAVDIRSIVFTVTASNVEIDPTSFELLNTLDPSKRIPCTANQPTLEITVRCEDIATRGLSSRISSGDSIALALRATVTRPQIVQGGSSLQVRLSGLSDRSTLGTVEWHDGSELTRWVDLPVSTVRSTLFRTR